MDSDDDEWSFTGFFYDFNNDGVEDEVDQSQCPFYGGWGEDVVADRLNHRHHKKHGHDALPELLFHCRDGDDCEEICDCLGGHIKQLPMFIKIAALVLSLFLSLTGLTCV